MCRKCYEKEISQRQVSDASKCDKCGKAEAGDLEGFCEWVGCDGPGCGRWFHRECLTTRQKKTIDGVETWLCHHCTWNKGWDKNDLKDPLVVKNLDAIREIAKFKATVKTEKIKEPEIDLTEQLKLLD